MGRRKDTLNTHADGHSTEKKKRKVTQEEPAKKSPKVNNGPSGWEEIEAVEAPSNGPGRRNLLC